MIYYFVAMVLFLFAFSIFNAIISIIIRDYYLVLQSLLRVLFYTTGVVWNLSDLLPEWTVQIFKLNPLMYIISGFRNALFYEEPLWSDISYTLYFWLVTGLVLFLGTMFYEKFKNRLLDFM
ncbi:techoic acid ABC transporter [Listeria fleischmannii subsp. fleischmannii LU2006-1]|nr:techoic acid ABC transporter [Listeria fleischmannii subsp. fleischmannii LU2006-1]